MLKIIQSITEVEFSQLMPIYEESNLENGKRNCPYGSVWEQLRVGEEIFRGNIAAFIGDVNCCLALWCVHGCSVAALRLEPYCDGLLISCLETAPKARGKGAATMLVSQVLEYYSNYKIYAHIHKNNHISLRLHITNGFAVTKDFASLLDGSVSHEYYTLIRK